MAIWVFLAHFSRFLGFFTTALGALMISCDYDILSLGQDDPHDNHDSSLRQERGHNEEKPVPLS